MTKNVTGKRHAKRHGSVTRNVTSRITPSVTPSVTPTMDEEAIAMAATLAVQWIEDHAPPARQLDITWVVTVIVFVVIVIASFAWLVLRG